jgi:hypothetical protein
LGSTATAPIAIDAVDVALPKISLQVVPLSAVRHTPPWAAPT